MNAHYTSYPVINAIYSGLIKAGFNGGNILEPSAGIGNFLAAMPPGMAGNSNVTAIEMDPLTGMILRHLFPTAETKIAPFEKTRLPENKYDLVISNVPFGDVGIFDPQLEKAGEKLYSKASNNLHNYFIAKSILLTRPGGVIVMITSRFTLDNAQASGIRDLMDHECNFLGAVRLPDNAFRANAGTDVVADIILLQKKDTGLQSGKQQTFLDVLTVPLEDTSGTTGLVSYNGYFHENPSHLLGTIEFGGLYSKEAFNLKGSPESNLGEMISGVFDKIFEKPVYTNRKGIEQTDFIQAGRSIKNYVAIGEYDAIGNIVQLSDNTFAVTTGENYIDPSVLEAANDAGIDIRRLTERMPDEAEERWLKNNNISLVDLNQKIAEPVRVSKADALKLPHLINLRQLTKEVIYREADGWHGLPLENKRNELKVCYQQFIKKFGHLTARENEKVLALDVDGLLIQSLERIDPISKKIAPADILFRPTIKPQQEINHTENVRDAIMLSIKRKGILDMNLVCELMDVPYTKMMATQTGPNAEIFIDASGNHIPREDFLSGNIRQKISAEEKRLEELISSSVGIDEIARSENNIALLKTVLPKPIEAMDIYAPLHSRWIPADDIAAFIKSIIHSDGFDISFSRSMDEFKLHIRTDNAYSDAFKTQRRKAEWVFNHALNGIEPIVNYTTEDNKQVFDAEDTHLAKEKYKAIRQAWDD